MDGGLREVYPDSGGVHGFPVDEDLAGVRAGLVTFGKAQRQDGALGHSVCAYLRVDAEDGSFPTVGVRKVKGLVAAAKAEDRRKKGQY